MKQYKMPLILGCLSWILAGLSLIVGIIDLVKNGVTKNTYFAAIILVGGSLSGINLLRLHRQLKYRKPPEKSNQPDTDASKEVDQNKRQNLN